MGRQVGPHDRFLVRIPCRAHFQHRLQIVFELGFRRDFFFDRPQAAAPDPRPDRAAIRPTRSVRVRWSAANTPAHRPHTRSRHGPTAALPRPHTGVGPFRTRWPKSPAPGLPLPAHTVFAMRTPSLAPFLEGKITKYPLRKLYQLDRNTATLVDSPVLTAFCPQLPAPDKPTPGTGL